VPLNRHDPSAADVWQPPAPSTIDLHTHSLRSDGLLTPPQLVAAAAAVGIRLLALADHDTLAGVRELRGGGHLPAGLELVAGVEINSVAGEGTPFEDGELHILGLGVDVADEAFEAVLRRQRDGRRVRYERMVERLREVEPGIDAALAALPVTGDEDALGRPRLARALMATGRASSVSDAFDRLLSRGRAAYVARVGVGPIQAISAIRAAGGLPVLAHFAEARSHLPAIRELIDAGLRGLEVYYRSYEQPIVETLASVADELRLVPTGGTDYHGDVETYAEAHAHLWVPPEVGDAVRAAMAAAEVGA
jgi:3',5'-nucleoside bisphosphate phosphatase